MHLLYLSKIGSSYDTEEGHSGHRLAALGQLEARLKKSMLDLRNLGNGPNPRLLPLPPGASVRAKAQRAQEDAIRKQQIDRMSPKDKLAREKTIADFEAQRKKLRDQIDRDKLWLRLEDAVVRPDGSIDWGVSSKNVVYDHDPGLQDMSRLRLAGGKIYKDDAHLQPFDTKNLVTHFSGPGKAIYVMTTTGAIHASSHSVGYRHHSSLLAGKSTAGAGEMEVLGGELKWISNKSGHYTPNIKHFLQALHVLEKAGISNSFRITYFSAAGKKEYLNTTVFQAALLLDGEAYFDYEFNKLMLYSEHLDDAVLGTHVPNPWRWRVVPEEPGVYDTTNNAPVPHRDVRRWLKTQGLYMSKEKQSGLGR